MIVLPLVATYHCQEVVNDVSCPDKEHSLMQLTGRCTVCLRISMAQGLVLYVWSVFDKHMHVKQLEICLVKFLH